jgi:predicted hotdog family 3-hydroxylacyl-ACP dehydratase
MTSPSSSPADAPLDDLDLALLDRVREMYQAADPMPEDLPERISFLLAMRDLEVEVARLATGQDLLVPAARGAEQSRTITFDSDSLTIMIRIDANGDGTVRLDGWLAPARRVGIELKTSAAAQALTASSDEQGRFAFVRVPRGTAQLVVRAEGHGRSVVTPALVL